MEYCYITEEMAKAFSNAINEHFKLPNMITVNDAYKFQIVPHIGESIMSIFSLQMADVTILIWAGLENGNVVVKRVKEISW